MNKIQITNPIAPISINDAINRIKAIETPSLLLLDFGKHDFESVEALKYCKSELTRIEATLKKFKKLAFLSIPPYRGETTDSSKLRYFNDEAEAVQWLLAED